MIRTETTHSPDETIELAHRLLKEFPDRPVYALYGELGSGKTCFVQGLADALGVKRIVTSPTFTILNEYPGEKPLYHADLYRINDSIEALSIGLEEYIHSGHVIAMEWAERAEDVIPPNAMRLRFKNGDTPDERIIVIE